MGAASVKICVSLCEIDLQFAMRRCGHARGMSLLSDGNKMLMKKVEDGE